MNFTIPELQSMIDMNSNQIAEHEEKISDYRCAIASSKEAGYDVPPQWYVNSKNKRKLVIALGKNQRKLKYAMRNMIDQVRENNAFEVAGQSFAKYSEYPTKTESIYSSNKQFHTPFPITRDGGHINFSSTTSVQKPDKNESVQTLGDLIKTKSGIGDVNSTEKGSGARFNDDKPDFSLIPLHTLEDEAKVWMYGEKKYARNNWKKGMKWSVPFACAMRHMSQWQNGEDIDKESGLPHLAHVQCNIRMLTFYAENYKEGDDRF